MQPWGQHVSLRTQLRGVVRGAMQALLEFTQGFKQKLLHVTQCPIRISITAYTQMRTQSSLGRDALPPLPAGSGCENTWRHAALQHCRHFGSARYV